MTYLDVDSEGRVNPDDLRKSFTPNTVLVSIMMANNETGTLQSVKELAQEAHSRGVLFHTDAVQAIGKIPVDIEELQVDLLTLSAHKIQGPKGIGAIFIRKGCTLAPLVHGGKQEHGLRAGTENVPAIAGLGKAAEIAVKRLAEMENVRRLRDRLETGIFEIIPTARRNGPLRDRLPNTLNMTLPGLRGESVVITLDTRGIALSSGSACRAGSPEPSHALLAMGMSEENAHCAVRFSLGPDNTAEEIDATLESIRWMIVNMSEGVRFAPCR